MTNAVKVFTSARVYDKQVGGNTRYVREVYSRLPSLGIEATFLRPKREPKSPSVRSAIYGAHEGLYWPLGGAVRANSVLHFPADTGAIVPAKIPVVSTIHGLATMHVDGVRSKRADALWKFRVNRLARVSDAIITVSDSSADDIARFIPSAADRVVVIPHGIDHGLFNTSVVSDGSEVRQAYSIPEVFFLYAGNLDPRKNIGALVDAAEVVFAKTGIPLVVSGAPAWDSAHILSRLQATPGVIYVGRTTDSELVSLMQQSVAFVFPSTYEGFGFPILEAMACGTAVISSRRGSLDSVAGDGAFKIDDIESPSIASAMLDVLGDASLRRSIAERGLEWVAKFNWETSAQDHASLFRRVAG